MVAARLFAGLAWGILLSRVQDRPGRAWPAVRPDLPESAKSPSQKHSLAALNMGMLLAFFSVNKVMLRRLELAEARQEIHRCLC
jgi:hypothetical protein